MSQFCSCLIKNNHHVCLQAHVSEFGRYVFYFLCWRGTQTSGGLWGCKNRFDCRVTCTNPTTSSKASLIRQSCYLCVRRLCATIYALSFGECDYDLFSTPFPGSYEESRTRFSPSWKCMMHIQHEIDIYVEINRYSIWCTWGACQNAENTNLIHETKRFSWNKCYTTHTTWILTFTFTFATVDW